MTKIINKNSQGQAVLKDSVQLKYFDTICEVNKIDNATSIYGIDIDEMDNICGSSQVECCQYREENENCDVNNCTPRNTYYTEALPLFE